MSRERVSLEESSIDDVYEGYSQLEQPLSRRVFVFFGILVIALGFFLALRVGYIGFVKGAQYKSRAYANAGQEIILRAPRGIIYDRYGTPLVKNEPSFDVRLNLSELFKDRERMYETIHRVGTYIPFNVEEIKQTLVNINLEKQSYITLARNVPLQTIIEIKKAAIPSVVVEDGYARAYPDKEMFSHMLGYIGLVSKDDLYENDGLDLNDEIGKSGIERVYDRYIRGKNGSRIILRDAKNNTLGERIDAPVQSGEHVYTTIDAQLQKKLYTTLKNQLTFLERKAGVGIAINPGTGEVLALVSLPSFDPHNLTKELFLDPDKPTFNRAISGLYSPGSTIKPLVAFAALEEGVVDPLTSVYSAGYIELPNPYNPDQPSRFVDWKPHGWVNLYSALARSSNVYFYEVGGGFEQQKGLGIQKLRSYWEKFLLDTKTGVDLPGEIEGYLPSPELKEKRTGQIWRIGDTYNVSIGQGDLLVSPMELIRYIGGIATKGKLFQPYIVSRVGTEKNVVYEKKQSAERIEQKNETHLQEVETGMVYGVSQDYGTSHMLASIPMAIAGKTGSAQIQNNQKTNAFFVGYAPIPNPQIALLILIEDAREGSLNAVPVARDVLEWYYEHRISDEVRGKR